MYRGSYSNPHGMHSIVENQNDMSGCMSKERFASNEISSKKNYPTNDHGKIIFRVVPLFSTHVHFESLHRVHP